MQCPHCYRQVSTHAKNCPSCGGHIPDGQHLLEDAGIIEAALNTANATPTERRKSVSPSARMAKLRDRFVAFVLDMVTLFGVFAVVDAWIIMRWSSFDGRELKLTTAAVLLVWILNTVILFAYGWLLEATFGATLGKALVGIRVVRTGERSALAASAIRNSLRIVDGLGLYVLGAMVAGCSPARQRLGDLCAGTAVVEEEFGAAGKVMASVVWIAALSAAIWALPRICSPNTPQWQTRYLSRVLVQVGRTENSAYLKIARLKFDIQLTSDNSSSAHI